MKKRIAIPVNENGILDGHFGHCKFFALIDLEEGIVLRITSYNVCYTKLLRMPKMSV